MFRSAAGVALVLCACSSGDGAGLFAGGAAVGGERGIDAAPRDGGVQSPGRWLDRVSGSGGAGGRAADAAIPPHGGVSSTGGVQLSGSGGLVPTCAPLSEVFCYGPASCRGTKLCNGDGAAWGACYCLQGGSGGVSGIGGAAGSGGMPCAHCPPAPSGGVVACTNGQCDFACVSGFVRSGGSCISNNGAGGATGSVCTGTVPESQNCVTFNPSNGIGVYYQGSYAPVLCGMNGQQQCPTGAPPCPAWRDCALVYTSSSAGPGGVICFDSSGYPYLSCGDVASCHCASCVACPAN